MFRWVSKRQLVKLSAISLALVGTPDGLAQTITSDATAGTTVNLASNTYSITGGSQMGQNLFHSFQRFGLNTGFTADFIDPGTGVTNIVGRVTGGQLSNVDGTLRAFANLFLVNPSGFVFGPNASLDVNGSFFATTADRVVFSDGTYFSATDTGGSTFSMAPPERFGFIGNAPAGITVNESVLTVPAGQRIGLIGGDVSVEGGFFGFFQATDGRIDLASVASAGEFDLTAPDAPVSHFNTLGTVDLSNFAFLDVSGNGGGKIVIRGGEVHVQQATLVADSNGFGNGGVIDVWARDLAAFSNNAQVVARPNSFGIPDGVRIAGGNVWITDGTVFDVGGDGGSRIAISGDELLVAQSVLAANTFGLTGGGGITIDMNGDATFGPGTLLLARNFSDFAVPFGIWASAENITMIDNAQLVTETFGSQPGGRLHVMANGTFAIRNDFASVFGLGGLFGDSFGSGAAGGIWVSASSMTMNEGEISAEPKASGLGGMVWIDVGEAEFRFGAVMQGDAVYIVAEDRVASFGTTTAGFPNFIQSFGGNTVTIDAPVLALDDAFIIANGSGIVLNATDMTIEDSFLASPNGIAITAANFTLGNGGTLSSIANGAADGGNISVNATESLTLDGSGGSQQPNITAGVQGTGNSGTVSLVARDIAIRNGIIGNAGNSGTIAGAIWISGETVSISDASQIEGSSDGSAPGTNISIQATDWISISGNLPSAPGEPVIQSSAFGTGAGGTISLITQMLRIDGANIAANSASSAGVTGTGGIVNVTADSVSIENGQISATTFGQADAGSINIVAGSLFVGQNAQVSSSTLGTGKGGAISVTGDSVTVRGGGNDSPSLIAAITSGLGEAGEVNLDVATLSLEAGGSVQASALLSGTAKGGNVNINASDWVRVTGTDGDGAPSAIGSFGVLGDAGSVNIVTPELILLDDGTIEASNTDGNAGNINLQVGRLEIGTDSAISAFTSGTGTGGRIFVEATEEILVAPFGGIVAVTAGSGTGGSIELHTPLLTVDGGVITSGSSDPFNAAAPTGPAGNVLIGADQLIISSGGKIDSSTSSTLATGAGGNVTVTVTGTAVINGMNENGSPSSIQSNTTGAAPGGTITISAGNLFVGNGGKVSSTSTGSKDATAGDITVTVATDLIMQNGAFTTQADVADGGNIKFNVGNIVWLTDSTITASVGQGFGGGGNIDIDPAFVILDSSQVIANAFGGPGGNITIVTGQFLASPDSVVSASSALGIAGNVVIDAPDTDIAGALAALPANLADAASQLAQQCSARGGRTLASFVGTGRGGLPVRPGGALPAYYRAGNGDGGATPRSVDAGEQLKPLSFKAYVRGAKGPGNSVAESAFTPATLVLSCSG